MATRPTRDEWLMEMAHVVAKRSTCSRKQVGAVISRDGRVLVTGYNGAPAGMAHCDHSCSCFAKFSDPLDRRGRHRHEASCNAQQPCTISVHDVANAIAYAARHGIRVEGADLHTTLTPCVSCAQLTINAGLASVHAAAAYRDTAGWDLLKRAGLELFHA